MTTDDRFERDLAAWLREESQQPVPDRFDAIVDATRRRPQRAWWSSPERWLPMDTLVAPRPANLRPILVLALIGALLVALLGAIVIGTPPPTQLPGLAANGRIFVVDGDTLRSFDASGGDARDVLALPAGSTALAVSPDGTRLAYVPQDTPVRIEFVTVDGGAPVPPRSARPSRGRIHRSSRARATGHPATSAATDASHAHPRRRP